MVNIRTDKKNISMNGYNLHIIANAIDARTLSGGDRILIELSKQWAYRGLNIIIHTNKNGHILCQTQGLHRSNIKIDYFHSFFVNSPFLPVAYLARVMRGTFRALRVNYHSNCLVYSSSDFWPDSLPAFIMKLRNKNIKWIAGFYLFAPKIWQKGSPYKGKRWFTGLFYWLTQLPVYWIVKKFADMVFVTSEPDVEKFVTKKRERDKILVIRGGVDTDPSEKYLNCEEVIPVEERKYDAVFIGRFHPQKGVLELIQIWREVANRKHNAKLAMIGVGPLEEEVIEKIQKLGLQGNIELLGFRDGEEKYKIFKQSKIVVHPATYDSGGMAACEAMAWALPGVSFDLEALKSYYPQGMIKTPCYDLKVFAENILDLIEDGQLYEKISKEAIDWAREWDWDKRAEDILHVIKR